MNKSRFRVVVSHKPNKVATVIGHEVGHVVARHAAEGITRDLLIVIGRIILESLWAGSLPNDRITKVLKSIILEFPWSRRMEKEADYIGLLVMASAGYDPREAPKVYRMFDTFGKSSDSKHRMRTILMISFQHTHLAETEPKNCPKSEVMEEAMTRYSKVIETRLHHFLIYLELNLLNVLNLVGTGNGI
ncbi:hypothetical protein POM88_032745 [Heracleum sosnowskyi]|uniref:Peptidase M48 domain-containing protein n=1 Tax=Heracleum sosnowskyi TaxID=360622 RepID=A0AAD8HZW4_9APIA|nr:hypothetical protein POM88_032745 [Heracleum sosnowskyi]